MSGEILGVCGLSEITISITKDKKSAASIITNELLFNFFSCGFDEILTDFF